MKILVTGGSGFMGINLIRYLLTKGCTVTSVDLLPFEYPEASKITAIIGDVRDKKLMEKLTAGVDGVVHCAAALPLYSPEDIYSTEVTGTQYVLDSALENKVPRFVHTSSTAVYGIPDHHPLIESDKLVGVGPYGEAKVEAEGIVAARRGKGMAITIIRPKSFIGPERLGVFALFYDWAADKRNFPMIGSGNNRYQLLDVEDLCAAVWSAITLPFDAVDDTFNIGAKEFTTMKLDWQAVLDHAGYGKKIIPLPRAPVVAILTVLEWLHLSPLYKWVYGTAAEDSFVSIEKAEQKLGYSPKYSNKQALIRNYEWYLAHRSEFAGKSGVTHRLPWKQGLLGIAKLFF